MFATGLDFSKALQKLGYNGPFVGELTPLQWLRVYTESEIAEPDERRKFLERVEGLPGFTH